MDTTTSTWAEDSPASIRSTSETQKKCSRSFSVEGILSLLSLVVTIPITSKTLFQALHVPPCTFSEDTQTFSEMEGSPISPVHPSVAPGVEEISDPALHPPNLSTAKKIVTKKVVENGKETVTVTEDGKVVKHLVNGEEKQAIKG